MIRLLCAICIILCIILLVFISKIVLMRKEIQNLRLEFVRRLKEDTNVGIDVSVSDSKIRELAVELNRQLKLLRKEQIRYQRGDQEVKNAITNISHDLRTPLTAICGYMDLLSKENVSDTVKDYLSIIDNRVLALKELTEELFRYSIVISSDEYKERKLISLNSMLEECIVAYYGALKEVGIEPEITIPKHEIKINLNEKALMRILSNIMSNAIKYSDGDLKIVLEDNGKIYFYNHAKDLDEIQVANLFDRFYTVESGAHSTGMGLSIARTLTEEMHGYIGAVYENDILCIEIDFTSCMKK
ncbi:MAG: HAMP domain-containing sensor histidine kinase [Lachnospiraceae bacterium]|nr:HAMP domain-containing sensor histidine kinase [Lachnospiraceae bacterium]